MIYIPIRAKNTTALIKKMKKAESLADGIEVWLDQLKNPDFKKIRQSTKKPIIFVNKGKKERGAWQGTEKQRIALLQKAVENNADYVDIGIQTDKRLIKNVVSLRNLHTSSKNAKIILSYHNFEGVPAQKTMEKIVDKAMDLGADIVKIAVFPHSSEDGKKIEKIAGYCRKKNIKYIVLGMGPHGLMTRIFYKKYGSYLTYASLNEHEKTAQSQLTAAELRSMLGSRFPNKRKIWD